MRDFIIYGITWKIFSCFIFRRRSGSSQKGLPKDYFKRQVRSHGVSTRIQTWYLLGTSYSFKPPRTSTLMGQTTRCFGRLSHTRINPCSPNDIYIYTSYRTANLEMLYFKYLPNKCTY